MGKFFPLLLMMIMGFLIFLSWNNVSNYNEGIEKEYNTHIQKAEALIEKEIYIDAVIEYEAAFKLRPENYDIAIKIADLYKTLEKKGKYENALLKAIEVDNKRIEPYITLADIYLEQQSWQSAYSILTRARENVDGGKDSSDINDRIMSIKTRYTVSSGGAKSNNNAIYPDGSTTGYMVIEKDGKYGLTDQSSVPVVSCQYEEIGILSNGVIPVKMNGEWYYIDKEGYRKRVPDREADYLGSFNEKYAVACFEGSYGWVDFNMKEYHINYDFTSNFSQGVAAAQKNGKWLIVDNQFKEIASGFDEVLLDDFNRCSKNKVIIARTGDTWGLYDLSCNKLADGFEEIRPFVSDEPTAVKQNGKWGFISKFGTVVIEPEYDEAKSFCIGYAPVKIGSKWGCIDTEKNLLIPTEFEDIDSFNVNGTAFAVQDGENCTINVTKYE